MVPAKSAHTRQAAVAGGGYVLLAAAGCPTLKVRVSSADQAVVAWERYRDANGLGQSDCKRGCGDIRGEDGGLVARVSYNSRVWSPDGQLLQER